MTIKDLAITVGACAERTGCCGAADADDGVHAGSRERVGQSGGAGSRISMNAEPVRVWGSPRSRTRWCVAQFFGCVAPAAKYPFVVWTAQRL